SSAAGVPLAASIQTSTATVPFTSISRHVADPINQVLNTGDGDEQEISSDEQEISGGSGCHQQMDLHQQTEKIQKNSAIDVDKSEIGVSGD
ncbi:hypothetical protein A2U01_0041092, partial [Trifolium medium]|nr:hypothetical protein [Trifolium medium]